MKKQVQVIVFMLITITFTACNKNASEESKLIKVFKEYVKTDWGNPENFIKITQFCEKDTIDKNFLLNMMRPLLTDSVFPNSIRWKRNIILDRINKDSTFIVDHKIKVRLRDNNGDFLVKEYHIIERDETFTVQDHGITIGEAPKVYRDALQLMRDYNEHLENLNKTLIEFGKTVEY